MLKEILKSDELAKKSIIAVRDELTPRNAKRFANLYMIRRAIASNADKNLLLEVCILDHKWPYLLRGLEQYGNTLKDAINNYINNGNKSDRREFKPFLEEIENDELLKDYLIRCLY